MKCPLLTAGMFADPTVKGDVGVECPEEECAWWHEGKKHCCIWSIETSLDVLGVLLAKIGTEMPHLEQFKRA